jgi:hypothetical protein
MKKIVKAKKKRVKKPVCHIENLSWLFQDVYAIHIIKNLLKNKENYFVNFKEEIKDLCDATLSKNLKTLLKEDIIEKEELKTFPRTVKYSLTKKGKGFLKILNQIEAFSKKY